MTDWWPCDDEEIEAMSDEDIEDFEQERWDRAQRRKREKARLAAAEAPTGILHGGKNRE